MKVSRLPHQATPSESTHEEGQLYRASLPAQGRTPDPLLPDRDSPSATHVSLIAESFAAASDPRDAAQRPCQPLARAPDRTGFSPPEEASDGRASPSPPALLPDDTTNLFAQLPPLSPWPPSQPDDISALAHNIPASLEDEDNGAFWQWLISSSHDLNKEQTGTP
ncbi:MAG: hypothetical protein OXC07_05080 [Kistimonas sp.]|nr:hypothetical protein [Kistimonas sp.]